MLWRQKEQKKVTLAFFVTALGKKEKPVFIWNQKHHGACEGLISLFYQLIILHRRKPG